MRSLWLAVGLWLAASAASAQVEAGNFKLTLETDLLNHTALVDSIDDRTYKFKYTTFGPGGSQVYTAVPGAVGLSLGYAVTDRVVPQLSLSFLKGSSKHVVDFDGDTETEDDISVSMLMMRPELEVALNPSSGAVAFVLAGVDYRMVKVDYNDDSFDGDDDTDKTSYVGPSLGLGVHFFAVPKASIDLAARFSYLIVELSDEDDDSNVDRSARIFSITAALSLWP